MKVGFIGLGKMGSRMAESLIEKKFELVLYARRPETMRPFVKKGATATKSYEEFAEALGKKKIALVMVTHGKPTDEVITGIAKHFSRGDIIIDCGNSFYRDSMKLAKKLEKKGIEMLDAGTSGGLKGAREGASIMVGGKKGAFKKAEPIFRALATKNGYGHMGKSGAGHFVKMIHNGIEYSLLQAYGEGYLLLEKSKFDLDLKEVTKVYQNGSVIRSWLIDLLAEALKKDPKLKRQSGVIGGGSTGTWTLAEAKKAGIQMPLLKDAMLARAKSFKKPDFSTKVVAALRNGFGGHIPPKK